MAWPLAGGLDHETVTYQNNFRKYEVEGMGLRGWIVRGGETGRWGCLRMKRVSGCEWFHHVFIFCQVVGVFQQRFPSSKVINL